MAAFCVLLVVDAAKFNERGDAELRDVYLTIREVLDKTLKASDLAKTWQAARFVENTGDGILAVLPVESAPRLMDYFPRCLQKELAERAPQLRARGTRLRLRAALHVGLVDDEYSGVPFSTAAIDVNRLLDAEPLRAALLESDPDRTYAAFIVSAKLFETYVAGGWTRVRESQFTEIRANAEEYTEPAYLYVPTPSARKPATAPKRGTAGLPGPRPGPGAGPAGSSMIGSSVRGDDPPLTIHDIVWGDLHEGRS